MSSAEPPPPPKPHVSLPKYMKESERERNVTRLTWLPPPSEFDAGAAPAEPMPARDPVLAALPPTVKYAALVVEANAIRHSAIGDLLVDCFFAGRPDMLGELRDAGFDPLTAVDRISVADGTLVVSGDFSHTDFKAVLQADSSQQYGRHATLYESHDGKGETQFAGVWKNQMAVMGRTPEEVKATLDRLDGQGAAARPLIDQEQAYGEMYGVMTGAGLGRMVSQENPELAKVLTEAATKLKLHADVSRDVGLVADVEGHDPAKTEELRKALGSALVLARMRAKADGLNDEASILDLARVGGAEQGEFRLEAGLPFSFLEKNLKACAERGRARRAARLLDGGRTDDE